MRLLTFVEFLEPATYGPTALRQGAVAYFAKQGDLSELVSGLDVLLASPT